MKRIVLLRHGESLWNKENRFTGWTDVDLSDKGIAEACKAGDMLKEAGFSFEAAYTSYLKRAVKTLNCVLDRLNEDWIPVEKSWRLNEKHYGILQGLNKRETADKYGEEQVHIWRRSYGVSPEPVKEDNPNSIPSTPVKDKKKVDERVEFTHPIKSSVIRIVFHTRIPCSQGKVPLSGNEASGAVQLHGVREHHLQGGGVGGVHLLRRLQPALQTQVQKREGGGSADEGDREQGAIHFCTLMNRTVCFSTIVIIQRARKCMGWREE